MKKKLLVIHGGGPTAVINCSLYGAVMEALDSSEIKGIYGADGGTGGLLKEKFINFTDMPIEKIEALKHTPGSAIGTSRDEITEKDYEKMADILKNNDMYYVLMNGGNGTMDTAGKLAKACKKYGIKVMGIPKTMDNDIAVTDHCPGYGSIARYMAASARELKSDINSLAIHVVVMESLGRNAGWATASSSLASDEKNYGPDLIYLPEVAFDEDRFLSEVETLYKKQGGVLVVASEGLKNKDGSAIVKPVFKTGRSVYFGDVSAHLSQLVTKRLGIKSRSEKPGLLSRASIAWQSDVDAREAEDAGRAAVKAVLEGRSNEMIAFRRISTNPYISEIFYVPIEEVMLHERKLPDSYIRKDIHNVTDEFKKWCMPLIGGKLPDMCNLR